MRTSLLLAIAFISVQLFSAGKPDPVFKEKRKEFTDIKQGTLLKFAYEFTNKGTADFKIEHVHPTCGCTVADWPKEPIPPGKSGKINVEFDTKDREGYQAKGVNIKSNAGDINLVFEVTIIK
jgi:hypothetical protein